MHIGLEKTEKINLARVKPARDRDRLGCFIPHPSTVQMVKIEKGLYKIKDIRNM